MICATMGRFGMMYVDKEDAMNIKTYLRIRGITAKQAAEELGVSPAYMRNISTGRNTPGKRLALAMEKWTNGQIKAIDLMDGHVSIDCCAACGQKMPFQNEVTPEKAAPKMEPQIEKPAAQIDWVFELMHMNGEKSFTKLGA